MTETQRIILYDQLTYQRLWADGADLQTYQNSAPPSITSDRLPSPRTSLRKDLHRRARDAAVATRQRA